LSVSYAVASHCTNGLALLCLLLLLALFFKVVLLGKMLSRVFSCVAQASAGRFCFAGNMLQDIAIYPLKPLIMQG